MATVAAPPAARPARPAPSQPAPPVRHGTCGITLRIGGNEYALRPATAGAPIRGVVTLRKIDSDPPSGPVVYAIATDGAEVHCTCPDHRHNQATCKHMQAIAAVARILAPFAAIAPAPAEPDAPPEAPAPAEAPAESPADQFRGAVRKEVARLASAPSPAEAPPWKINDRLEEGWQPGGAPAPAPSPTPAKAKARKARRPKPLPCLECGAPIAAPSPDPAFCADCFAAIQEGGAQ